MKKQLLILSMLSFLACMSPVITFATTTHTKPQAKTTNAEDNGAPLDRVIATVGDQIISQSELDAQVALITKRVEATHQPMPPINILRKQVLNQMINHKLQLMLAKQANIKVSDADMDKTISNIANSNHVDVATLYKKVNEEGMTTAEYRKSIHDEIVIQQIEQSEVAQHVVISPEEVDEFMHSKAWKNFNTKEYHLKEIFIALPAVPAPEEIMAAKQNADMLVAKLHQGASFESLAMMDSSAARALSGGDLGWRKLAEFPTPLANQVSRMKVGAVIGPITNGQGFHIIKLDGIRESVSPATSREQVKRLIFQRKMEDKVNVWLTKLRSQLYIEVLDPTLVPDDLKRKTK